METTKETKFGTKVAWGEDDAGTSNICKAQRKHVIPRSMMKTNRNIIQCCDNTYQVAPHTGKQMYTCASDLDDGQSCYLYCMCLM